ncbi:MAG: RES domain-containing protein [Microvirga sp.]
MRFKGTVYRAHNPRWAFSPLSGEGAARTGGRFNRPDVPALYTSLTLETAVREAAQGFARKLDPLTLCSYDVDVADIADLRVESQRKRLGIAAADLACPWKLLAHEGKPVPSWLATDKLVRGGHAGILVRSFAPGATEADVNLVLWHWGANLPHRVKLHDPERRLPRNQKSWSD